ncbi:MAG TPA: NUDIX hydrolase [Candidatus Saccharibacteria bacterium]|jgi:8-oxo-dGTP pyrophosphatase MutT (NUDIX family)|nr:NUDIX hydrolase [Candidatus Saccharibacteria bacterium]HMR38596.1 NUDIX hydrolase [Candidatus Saccharibacteria bacterium]
MINEFKVIVSGFVFNSKGELLVIRRALDEETFPGMLAIPGGTVEVTENSGLQNDTIEENLIREVEEETGVTVTVGRWLESSAIAKDKAKLYLFFECQATQDVTPVTSSETPEAFWIDPANLNLDECTPSLKQYATAQR